MKLICEPYSLSEIKSLALLGVKIMNIEVEGYSARSLFYFKEEDLTAIRGACDEHQVEMYVDLNAMYTDEELERVSTFMLFLKDLHVDGIYFTDLGVLQLAKELDMCDLMIYQPDTLIVNNYDAKFYLDLGLKGICAARELTLEELKEICNFNANKVEVFIHGHMLMSASKRPLLPNYFEHMKMEDPKQPYYYLKEELRDGLLPVIENERGTHFYSSDVLVSFDELFEFCVANAAAGHINRMFLSFEELCDALKLYNEMLSGLMSEVEWDYLVEKYPDTTYSSGFYYQKTSVKKEL